ncbi:MAG: hypothetical protein M0Q40_07275 [Limnochordia bacterium]|nr:hypothetical protein [Limnochordia bacterium]
MSLTTNRLTIGLLLLTLCLAAPVAAAEVDGQYTLKLAVPLETDQPIDESIGSVGLKTDIESDLGNLGIWKLRITASYDNKLDELKDTWNEEHTDIVREQITMGFDEAYVDLYSVADSDLDLRLGKQFVTVGIGDGISTLNLTEPVQALSVNDLSSRAVIGVRADWYPQDTHIIAFVQPRVTPTCLGPELEASLESAVQQELLGLVPAGFQIGKLDAREVPIDYGKEGLGYTFKGEKLIGRADLGLVYQKGYVPFAVVSDFKAEPMGETASLAITIDKKYMPLQKIGITAAGTMGDASVWGEMTYNIPKKDFFASVFTDNPALSEQYRFSDETYLTGMIGVDYFLPKDIYVNIQAIRGFPHEFAKSMLSDYVIVDSYKYFLNNRLKVDGKMIYCLRDKGWVALPEVEYQVKSNIRVFGQITRPGGDAESLFGQLENAKMVTVGANVSF